jgi:hypothetical protein
LVEIQHLSDAVAASIGFAHTSLLDDIPRLAFVTPITLFRARAGTVHAAAVHGSLPTTSPERLGEPQDSPRVREVS